MKIAIAIITLIASAQLASAAVTIRATVNPANQSGNTSVRYQLNTSVLTGTQLEGAQLIIPYRDIYVGGIVLINGLTAYRELSPNSFNGIDEFGALTGDTIIELNMGKKLASPFIVSDEGAPFGALNWQNENLGNEWEVILYGLDPYAAIGLRPGGYIEEGYGNLSFRATAAVPEPSRALLLGLGMLGFVFRRRR